MPKESDFWQTRLSEWTVLDPPARISEILFGLIMVLTFTCTISVSTAGRQEVSELLWAALGCNLAWGLVDGIMYLMDELIGRAHGIKLLKNIRLLDNKAGTRKMIRESINPLISDLMEDEDIDRLGEKIKKLPDLHLKKTMVLKNFLVAGQIFLLVFLVTVPVAIPFVFVKDVTLAIRLSNAVALVLMFVSGFALARYSGMRPVLTALVYMFIGVVLVGMTMALGG
jgi:hypothetical protein